MRQQMEESGWVRKNWELGASVFVQIDLVSVHANYVSIASQRAAVVQSEIAHHADQQDDVSVLEGMGPILAQVDRTVAAQSPASHTR